jgi:vacuolar-type H+-ATPase subunit B/Vma2
MTTSKFETGATSHAVNDLILFTDNTRELAELRDEIYTNVAQEGDRNPDYADLSTLYRRARMKYVSEFGSKNSLHITQMKAKEIEEFCNLYISDFENWKAEHKTK